MGLGLWPYHEVFKGPHSPSSRTCPSEPHLGRLRGPWALGAFCFLSLVTKVPPSVHREYTWGRSAPACAPLMGGVAGRIPCRQSHRLRRCAPLGSFRGNRPWPVALCSALWVGCDTGTTIGTRRRGPYPAMDPDRSSTTQRWKGQRSAAPRVCTSSITCTDCRSPS